MTSKQHGPLRVPLSLETTNTGFRDRWTCPACYEDMDADSRGGSYTCLNCGHDVELTRDTVPVCIARIVTGQT